MNNRSKKLFATIHLFTLLALLPMGCDIFCADSCGCGSGFKNQSLLVKSFEAITIAGDGQEIQPTSNLPYDQVFKAIRVNDFELISFEGQDFFEPWSLGTAYACSPPIPISESKLTSLKITNLREVILGDGTRLQVGKDITAYFGINDFYSQGLKPIDQFLESGKEVYLDGYFRLGFTNEPGAEVSLEFSIGLTMDNGEEFLLNNQTLGIR
jgi:hypothetical protein